MNGNSSPPIVITDRDRQLFAFLAEAKLLDREQIQQLLPFASVTRTNDRLSRLHSNGLLRRCFVGTGAGGRKALYALSSKGASVIGREKFWRLRSADGELLVGDVSVEHKLAVNWCWLAMLRDCGANSVRFTRFDEPISPALPLAPDGYAELDLPTAVHPLFLEVDMTTETSRVWEKKVELYLKLAASGEFERMFRRPRFKVAVVCTSERRLKNLRKVIRKQTAKLFYLSLLQTIKRDGFLASPWLRPDGDAHESIT
jgi:hypothetical protein